MDELKRILAIPAADRTDTDRAYLEAHAEELTDEQNEQLKQEQAQADAGNGGAGAGQGDAGAGTDDEEAEEKALREMITKDIQETVGKKVDKLADRLVEKFMAGATEQRKKALAGNGNGGRRDPQAETRKFFKALLSGDQMALKALSNGNNAEGGYLVPVELRNEIVRIANDTYGVARRDMRYIPVSGPGNTFPVPNLASGVTVYWTDEKVKKRSSQPGFGLLQATLKKLAVIVPWTDEWYEDVGIDVNGLIGDLVAESMAMEEDIQFFTGNGTIFTGILNNANVVKVTLPTGTGPAEITADDLLNMINAAPASIKKTGKFYLSSSVLAVIQKVKDTTGRYIWGGPTGDTPGTIWGRPYEIIDAMDAVGDVATGEAFIIFTDLRKTAMFFDKKQIRVKQLTEATITDVDNSTVLNLAQQDMSALRFVERVGYVLALPKGVVVLVVSSSGS